MFDIGWSEMMVIGALALIVIGPKDLPKALKTVGKWVRRAKDMAREFQSGVDEMVRESELEEARETLRNTSSLDKKIADTVDPSGEMTKAMREQGESIQRDLEKDETEPAKPAPAAAAESKPVEDKTAAKPAPAKPAKPSVKKAAKPAPGKSEGTGD
ncbi:MAG: Sec-independent protein translocase protein TatB [Rhodospirillales bacterium]